MANSAPAAYRRYRRWLHNSRPRLLVGTAAGIIAAMLAPASLRPTLRVVAGWDIGIVVYLTLLALTAARTPPSAMAQRARQEDPARWVLLGLMAGAAWFSMFALLGVLHEARGASGGVSLALTVLAAATILLSWLLAHTAFAVHYAFDYYADRAAGRPSGLVFPGDFTDYDFWDFLYFSFVVGMTCQVSDVQVATAFWRRLVLAHGVVSFLFNTVVLALTINLLAGQL